MQKVFRKPIIGITCGEIHNQAEAWSPVTFGQSRTYVDSILEAEGIPLLLPLTEDTEVLDSLCKVMDGLCLAGGNDVHPALYGDQPRGIKPDYSQLRDATEQILLRRIFADQKPILGICRGMQLLNIHFGGTLYQDITEELPGSLDHDASTKLQTLVDLSHILTLESDSKLATILGPQTIGTNAHHHQAIKKLGNGISAVAWAQDGVIEAIELIGYPYAVGVQAHPESLTSVEPRWKQLFTSFVSAAKRFAP